MLEESIGIAEQEELRISELAKVADLNCVYFPAAMAPGEANLDRDVLMAEGFWEATLGKKSVQVFKGSREITYVASATAEPSFGRTLCAKQPANS